jgi:hypothetical protein
MASRTHRYCLPLSRRRLDFEPLQVDEDGKEYTAMSSGWKEREKVSFFSFPISLVEHLPQGNVSENARLQIEVRLSLVQSRWVYSGQYYYHHYYYTLKKGWIIFPKGLARLLLVKTSVSKWRIALIYFHLLFLLVSTPPNTIWSRWG